MNIALRTLGALLIVCGLCLLLASPWSSQHSSYTSAYIDIISIEFKSRPTQQEAATDPQTMKDWHNLLAGTLETYANKVRYEQPQSFHAVATILQIIGVAILFLSGRNASKR